MSARFGTALVVGKFLPYHKGHALLLDEALAIADRVVVLVCATADQPIAGEVRRAWVEQSRPQVEAVLVDQDALALADDNTQGWADASLAVLGRAPDVVVTSEPYGEAFARALRCVHHEVDRGRVTVPVSATAIRSDALAHLESLEPHVRAYFVLRVCVIGAESTGKTTIAAALAERYASVWVPEYGAIYNTIGRPEPAAPWTSDEFVHIARMRNWLEDHLAGYANGVLFCDTDTFVTGRFHELYLGLPNGTIDELADERSYDLYLLCDPRTPFVQDELELRTDGPPRLEMHAAYARRLAELGAPHLTLAGTRQQRLEQAARAVDALLASPVSLAR